MKSRHLFSFFCLAGFPSLPSSLLQGSSFVGSLVDAFLHTNLGAQDLAAERIAMHPLVRWESRSSERGHKGRWGGGDLHMFFCWRVLILFVVIVDSPVVDCPAVCCCLSLSLLLTVPLLTVPLLIVVCRLAGAGAVVPPLPPTSTSDPQPLPTLARLLFKVGKKRCPHYQSYLLYAPHNAPINVQARCTSFPLIKVTLDTD